MVWDLLLKADPEGPSPIFHAALRHRFHTHTGTPLHVSLQHTLIKKFDHEPELKGRIAQALLEIDDEQSA